MSKGTFNRPLDELQMKDYIRMGKERAMLLIDDDFSIYDDDDAICDDDRDGLTPEEAYAYNREYAMLQRFKELLLDVLGNRGYADYMHGRL